MVVVIVLVFGCGFLSVSIAEAQKTSKWEAVDDQRTTVPNSKKSFDCQSVQQNLDRHLGQLQGEETSGDISSFNKARLNFLVALDHSKLIACESTQEGKKNRQRSALAAYDVAEKIYQAANDPEKQKDGGRLLKAIDANRAKTTREKI